MKLKINPAKILHKVEPTLYGLFFEDINYGADGGINAELIANNSFNYEYFDRSHYGHYIKSHNTRFWFGIGEGDICAIKDKPKNTETPYYLKVDILKNGYRLCNRGYQATNTFGVANGMGVFEGAKYNFTICARAANYKGKIKVNIASLGLEMQSNIAEIEISKNEWRTYKAELICENNRAGMIVIEFDSCGCVEIDNVSLLPQDVWGFGDKKWSGGKLRKDIVEAFRDAKPSFFRFPGGCVVEGDLTLGNLYNWKNTIGELEQRPHIANTWGYCQSNAVGFYEYFLLCEDIGTLPLPILHLGLTCQIRGDYGHGGADKLNNTKIISHSDSDFMPQVVDYIAHLIFYALGDAKSSDKNESFWAAKRVAAGHSEPFKLKFLGVGNENWGSAYFDNLSAAIDCLKNYDYKGKKTDIVKAFGVTLVTTVGVDIRAQDKGNDSWKTIAGEAKFGDMIVDEHIYRQPEYFIENVHRYDSYDRNLNKVFLGEWAAHTHQSYDVKDVPGGGENSLASALSEAVFMTGLEKNSDIVAMAAYAPLLAKAESYQWRPNLIWFNGCYVMKTPNYYVQQMFASFIGDELVESGIDSNEIFQSVTKKGNILFVKLVNPFNKEADMQIDLQGKSAFVEYASEMSNSDPTIINTIPVIGEPIIRVEPKEISNVDLDCVKLSPYSVTVLKLKLK